MTLGGMGVNISVYRAFSFFEEFRGINHAKLFWIPLRAERIRVAPYNMLIENITELDMNKRSLAKGFADEFFTLSELNLFRDYMNSRMNIEIQAEEYPIPISCVDLEGNSLIPFRCLNMDTAEGVFNIGQGEIPSLPFGIAGFL